VTTIQWVGRQLCRMRLHRWCGVTVIDRFDLTGVTVTRDQFDEMRAAWPPAPPKPFEPPWEAAARRFAGVPVWLGGSAMLNGRVLQSHKEARCRRCGHPRGRPRRMDGMHEIVGRPPGLSSRPSEPPPPDRPR
jgi:hypothetical protein